MADVYDFKTGKLCKCCKECNFWKEVDDFPLAKNNKAGVLNKYGVGPICHDCTESQAMRFVLDMEPDDEVA